jgi:hypothetical protein
LRPSNGLFDIFSLKVLFDAVVGSCRKVNALEPGENADENVSFLALLLQVQGFLVSLLLYFFSLAPSNIQFLVQCLDQQSEVPKTSLQEARLPRSPSALTFWRRSNRLSDSNAINLSTSFCFKQHLHVNYNWKSGLNQFFR